MNKNKLLNQVKKAEATLDDVVGEIHTIINEGGRLGDRMPEAVKAVLDVHTKLIAIRIWLSREV